MAARDQAAPQFAYLFAVVVGLIFMELSLYMTGLLADVVELRPQGFVRAVPAAAAAVYAVAGAAFGLLWPARGWRWGVWLCAFPVCLVSFFAPDWRFYLSWAALTVPPACAGAYAAAGLRRTYRKVKGRATDSL